MTRAPSRDRPRGLASFLIVAGVIGWIAAFALTLEKLALLRDPGADALCDFSLIVQCTANLESWQGSVLGFPNPLIGLAAWIAPLVVGVGVLAGARFARWFWALFAVGVAGGFAFVLWLIGQSIFVLGTLCPWCMVTWSVTIPLFWAVTLYALSTGAIPLPAATRRIATGWYGWVPALTVFSYVVIAVVAQVRLDVLGQF